MQAIILAAGMGSRLKHLTQNNTKCMVKVNGVSLIDRMLHQLDKQGLSRIIIVVGYEAEKLKEYIGTLSIATQIIFIDNPIYATTNNIYSLALAGEYLCQEDSLLLESDLIFEDSVLDALVSDPRATLALVDKYARWMDGTCIRLDEDDRIVDFIPSKKFSFAESGDYYKTVNIYKFSKRFSAECYVPFLEAYQKAMGLNEYYEQVLRVISVLDSPRIRGKRLEGQLWYEIDDEQDLEIAESMFLPDRDARTAGMIARNGGYWRYPSIMDFSSAVNPFFPPKKLIDEMQTSFTDVLKQYPSDSRILSLLAAKNFSVQIANILEAPGRDAALQLLVAQFGGLTRISFDEVPALLSGSRVPDTGTLLISNPDPVSGCVLDCAELQRLTAWAEQSGYVLAIDESLADFSETDCSLLSMEYLNANPHLFLVRDISSCRGVPGLCLAVLISGNADAINAMKNAQPRGSVSTISEFYLQIEEKYKKEYAASLARFRAERARLAERLGEITGLRVIPSQGSAVLMELTGGMTAAQMAKVLLYKHSILIDTPQVKEEGEYIRLSIRTEPENDVLIEALRVSLA